MHLPFLLLLYATYYCRYVISEKIDLRLPTLANVGKVLPRHAFGVGMGLRTTSVITRAYCRDKAPT